MKKKKKKGRSPSHSFSEEEEEEGRGGTVCAKTVFLLLLKRHFQISLHKPDSTRKQHFLCGGFSFLTRGSPALLGLACLQAPR